MGFLARLNPHLTTRQYISIGKGSLCYTLVFVLVFLRGFNSLIDYPIVATSMVIVSIAGQPGLAVGACLDNGLLGMAGVGFGSFWFWLLAIIPSRVGQGFVLFVLIYILAYIKAQSLRYFAFSLLAILVAFSGIYTSILLGRFDAAYLEAYLKAYCFGFAIVLGVNILVFPSTSEREVRELLVTSLEHISTFVHLLAKTYALEITDEERTLRDSLNQSIRADYGLLMVKTAQAGLEVNWTRYSMASYASMIARIKQMQAGLITCYSSLVVMEKFHPEALHIVKQGLEETGTGKAFRRLRRSMDLCVSDIVKELAVGKQVYHSPAGSGAANWEDFLDLEEEQDLEGGRARARAPSVSPNSPQVQDQLDRLTTRLRNEVQGDNTPMASRRGSFSGAQPSSTPGTTATPSSAEAPRRLRDLKSLDRVAFLRGAFDHFRGEQNAYIIRLLAEGFIDDDELRLHKPGQSLWDQYVSPSNETVRSHLATAVRPPATQPAQRKASKSSDAEVEGSQTSGETQSEKPITSEDILQPKGGSTEQITGTMVLRIFSFSFGMGQVLDELASLHSQVVPTSDADRPAKRLHFHVFERIPKAAQSTGMALRQAVAILTGRDFVEQKQSIWTRIAMLEKFARSDTSIYAFKTACAVIVFAVFLLAPSLTSFFVLYGLTGGLISIVVAMSPTLGQSVLTFILQISGTAFGTVVGMVFLYIWRHVGSYYFNPFGLTTFIALFSIPLMWIIYCRPMFFAGALLALNGLGVLVITEWVYREIPGQIRPNFDNPGLRAGKALTALALALGIAGVFMCLILRAPARQTLRIKLSQITFSLSSYAILLTILVEAHAPMEPGQAGIDPPPPNAEAVATVRAELMRREGQIQAELLGLMPLMKFSAAEPAWGQPFQGAVIARIIRSNQVILDRLREARTAIGSQGEGFGPEIRRHFTSQLAPYRRQNKRFTRALFYLISTSLATKTPLPHELPTMITAARNLQHDALVLTGRLARTEQGRGIIGSPAFLGWYFFVISYSGVAYNLEAMECDLRILLGNVEDSPFVTQERDVMT